MLFIGIYNLICYGFMFHHNHLIMSSQLKRNSVLSNLYSNQMLFDAFSSQKMAATCGPYGVIRSQLCLKSLHYRCISPTLIHFSL